MDIRIPERITKYCRAAIIAFAAAILLLAGGVGKVHADDSVVLIAAEGSGIESISSRDLRRVFLGLRSTDSTMVKKPIVNLNNRETYEKFLKNVMHMTEGAYKRKLVKRVFRNGAEEIQQIEELRELNEHLITNVGDISFVEESALDKMHDIEVLQVLW